VKKLAEKLGVKPYTVKTYLCRSEFAHLEQKRVKGDIRLLDFTINDFERLQELTKPRRACI
jgi:uncharacterized protein YjcR